MHLGGGLRNTTPVPTSPIMPIDADRCTDILHVSAKCGRNVQNVAELSRILLICAGGQRRRERACLGSRVGAGAWASA